MGSIDPGCGPQLYVVASVRSSTGSTGLQRRPQCARSTTETQRARTSPEVHEPIDPYRAGSSTQLITSEWYEECGGVL